MELVSKNIYINRVPFLFQLIDCSPNVPRKTHIFILFDYVWEFFDDMSGIFRRTLKIDKELLILSHPFNFFIFKHFQIMNRKLLKVFFDQLPQWFNRSPLEHLVA